MENRYDVFDYCLINSRIHNLNFVYKILSIILVLICLIMADSVIDIIVINFFLFIIMLWSNVRIRLYIRNLNSIKIILLLVFLVFSFIYLNVFVGILWCIKVMDIVIYLSIIMMTTTLNDVVYGLERLLRPIKGFVNVSDISLKMGMYMKFITILYSEGERIKNSKKLRGVRFKDISFIDKIDYLINGIVPVYRSAIDRLERLKNVMYVRNYGVSLNRCNYRLNKWGKTDTILLVINVVIILVIGIY